MKIDVLTPERKVYSGEIQSVLLPGVNGMFEILDNHAPIVSALGQGTVRLRETDGKDVSFEVEKGFVEVLKNEVSLLVQGYKEL